MRDQQQVEWDQGIDNMTHGNESIDHEVGMHHQYEKADAGNSHFHDGKEVEVFLDKPVHDDIGFYRAFAKQYGSQERIRKAQQRDNQCRQQGLVTVPVNIVVEMVFQAS